MQHFAKIITWFGGLSPKSRLILIYQPFVIKQKSMMVFLFLKVGILERSSHRRCSLEKAVLLTISQNSQENICARVSFLNFTKKGHCTGVFWWILEFLRIPFLRNTSGRMLLTEKTKKCSDPEVVVWRCSEEKLLWQIL